MPNKLNQYQQKTADWRKTIRDNNRRTHWVIACFILIYLAIGLLIDVYFRSDLYPQASNLQVLKALVTGEITPYATLITTGIACISLWVTFVFYNRFMLLGTAYKEITEQTDSLTEKQLFNIVDEMRLAAGMAYRPKIYVINANYMNAFASGYSEKSAMIAITQGLLDKLNREQLGAVIAHELSHIRHGDIKLTLMASVLSNLLLIMIDVLFFSVLFGGRGRNRERGGGNQLMIIIIVLRYLLPLITMLLMLFLSRSREYMADAGCVELTRNNEPLAQALLIISQDSSDHRSTYSNEYKKTAHENIRRASYIFDPSQAGIKPAGSLSDIFSTHPSIKKRLRALGFKSQDKDSQ